MGLSQILTNYAEEWHLLPPTIWSTFDGSTQYFKNEALGMVLDPVRVKDLSPVRKQSGLETDLSSKFKSLAARAQWSDPAWLTYDNHQLSLILAMAIQSVLAGTNKSAVQSAILNREAKPPERVRVSPIRGMLSEFRTIPILASDDARILGQVRDVLGGSIVLITDDKHLALLAKSGAKKTAPN